MRVEASHAKGGWRDVGWVNVKRVGQSRSPKDRRHGRGSSPAWEGKGETRPVGLQHEEARGNTQHPWLVMMKGPQPQLPSVITLKNKSGFVSMSQAETNNRPIFRLIHGSDCVSMLPSVSSHLNPAHPSWSRYQFGIHCMSCSDDSAKSMQFVVIAMSVVASMTFCQLPMPAIRLQRIPVRTDGQKVNQEFRVKRRWPRKGGLSF